MTTITTKLIGAALLLWISLAAQADTGMDGLLEVLRLRYPSTKFTDAKESGLPGIYEVTMGRNIAYTDRDGRLFLFGHLFDMTTQRDLTAERQEAANRLDFDSLPLGDAIKTVRGNGGKVVAVFSDPDCPYCRKLEQELGKVDDITVYTFLMPLVQLHPQAKDKSVAVWCANDRSAAWQSVITQDTKGILETAADSKGTCEHPVDRNLALAARLGINGTPTLIAGDGRMKSGALPAEEISGWLGRSDKVSEVRK